jgi:phosphatidylinositol dimannoside acyltransferase
MKSPPNESSFYPRVTANRRWWDGFAVEGIQWRRFIDWAIRNVPASFQPTLIWIGAVLFFFIAAPARRSVVQNLALVLPRSGRLANHLRTIRVFANFGWMLTDAAVHRLLRSPFKFDLEGENFLEQLSAGGGAIVLTAHMGNYDLGAEMFAKKFNRQLRMVRAPEPDALTARHVDIAFHQTGGVRVDYSHKGTELAFDLLNALREREIISIQGDRVVGELARASVEFFGRNVLLPTGPFVLSLTAEAPIFPLFIIRTGFREYKVVACEPIVLTRGLVSRDDEIARAMAKWSDVLEEIVRQNWSQWYAFKPLF